MKRIGTLLVVFALAFGFSQLHAQSAKRSIAAKGSQKSGIKESRASITAYKDHPGATIHEISMPNMDETRIAHLEAAVAEDQSFLAVEVNRKKNTFKVVFAEEASSEKVEACIMAMVDGRMRRAGNEHR